MQQLILSLSEDKAQLVREMTRPDGMIRLESEVVECVLMRNGTKQGNPVVWILAKQPNGDLVGLELTGKNLFLASRIIAHDLLRTGELSIEDLFSEATTEYRRPDCSGGDTKSDLVVYVDPGDPDAGEARHTVQLYVDPRRGQPAGSTEPVVFASATESPNTYAALLQLAKAIESDNQHYPNGGRTWCPLKDQPPENPAEGQTDVRPKE